VLRFISLSVVLATLVLFGCATEEKDKTLKMKPEELYEEARDSMNGALYDKAIALYDKLEGRAAGTVLAQQAQLDKAYALYKNGDRATAIVTLDRFIKLNPASPALDYALYLKGTVNFNDDLGLLSKWFKQDLAERDQMAARESFEAYKELVTRFPNPTTHQTPLCGCVISSICLRNPRSKSLATITKRALMWRPSTAHKPPSTTTKTLQRWKMPSSF
jgi:outer membrane assembly lipoprotein YfiO